MAKQDESTEPTAPKGWFCIPLNDREIEQLRKIADRENKGVRNGRHTAGSIARTLVICGIANCERVGGLVVST